MYKLCKTEHSAARQRQIEYGLLDLMSLKPYDDISVSDLCDHMQIPRKSFYRYFSGKEGALHALLDHTMLDYEGFNAVYLNNDRRTLEKELSQFFMFWLTQKKLLDVLVRNKLSGLLVERALSNAIQSTTIPQRFLRDLSPFMQKQINLFCISGLMSIVLTWHQDGYQESVEQMAESTTRLLSYPLFPDIQDFL